jgi:hypothetical protein
MEQSVLEHCFNSRPHIYTGHNVGKNRSHFVTLEGKFLLIALVIVTITEM